MSEFDVPWLEIAILVPLLGAPLVRRQEDAELARRWSIALLIPSLLGTLGAAYDFYSISDDPSQGTARWLERLTGFNLFAIDQISAPLVSVTALLYLLTSVATLRTKVRHFSFAWMLVSESLVLATLACQIPWLLIGLMVLNAVPPWFELRARGRSTRVFTIHMALFAALLIGGWASVQQFGGPEAAPAWTLLPIMLAVLVRSGAVPVHCWMTDLFEHATLGTAMLFVLPLTGAYAAVRLVLPTAPDWILHSLGMVSLLTAVYAAGMSLVQRDARRFFCYQFLSHSSLVLAGLKTITPIGLTGALCVWISVVFALGGFGITLRALEARRGPLSLVHYAGGYEQTPTLAIFFLMTGMASVGFPGTLGFLGAELLVDGAVQTYPHVGIAVVVAAAMNGIAVVRAYFVLFTGVAHRPTVNLRIRRREMFAVLTLSVLILGGGLWPQPGVASRHRAAMQLLSERHIPARPKAAAPEIATGPSRAPSRPAR